MNSPVKSEATPVDNAGGANVDIQIQRIHSTEELERALSVDVEASYGSGAFGPSVSARFSYAKNSKVQSSSLFMSVSVKVELGFLSIDTPQLTDEAAEVIENPELFEARYGNMFVRGLGRGGLFVGVLRVDTGSSEESLQIAAELQGSYSLFSGSAATKFSEVQEKYKNEVFVRQYQEGGPMDLKINDPSEPLELLTNAKLFQDAFAQNPDKMAVPYIVTLAPTTIAEGPLPPNPAEIQKAQDVLIYCAKRRSVLLDQMNLLDFVSANEGRFNFTEPTSIDTAREAVEKYQVELGLIADCASAAINNRSLAKMPAEYAAEHGKSYPIAVLPTPMPTPKASVDAVVVPDFATCASREECQAMAAEKGLTVAFTTAGVEAPFHVEGSVPPPGVSVDIGSTVTIICPPTPTVVGPVLGWKFNILEGIALKMPNVHIDN